jgi:hypothetical protein
LQTWVLLPTAASETKSMSNLRPRNGAGFWPTNGAGLCSQKGHRSAIKRFNFQPRNRAGFGHEGRFVAHKWGRSLFTKGAPFRHQTVKLSAYNRSRLLPRNGAGFWPGVWITFSPRRGQVCSPQMGQVSVHKRGTLQPSNGLTFSPETVQASAKKRGRFFARSWVTFSPRRGQVFSPQIGQVSV